MRCLLISCKYKNIEFSWHYKTRVCEAKRTTALGNGGAVLSALLGRYVARVRALLILGGTRYQIRSNRNWKFSGVVARKKQPVVKRPSSLGDIHAVTRRAQTSSRYGDRRATCVGGRWPEYAPG